MVVSFSEYGSPNMSIVDEMGKLGVLSMVVTEADTHGEGMSSGSAGVTGKGLGNTIGEIGGVNTRGSLRTESDIGTKADGAGDEDIPESTDERRPMNSAGGSAVGGDTGSAETSDDDRFASSKVDSAWNMAGGSGAMVVPESISRMSKGEGGGKARTPYGAAA